MDKWDDSHEVPERGMHLVCGRDKKGARLWSSKQSWPCSRKNGGWSLEYDFLKGKQRNRYKCHSRFSPIDSNTPQFRKQDKKPHKVTTIPCLPSKRWEPGVPGLVSLCLSSRISPCIPPSSISASWTRSTQMLSFYFLLCLGTQKFPILSKSQLYQSFPWVHAFCALRNLSLPWDHEDTLLYIIKSLTVLSFALKCMAWCRGHD